MKFGDLAIFAKVGWDILENRVKCPEIHENESHFAIHFRGATTRYDGPRVLVRGDFFNLQYKFLYFSVLSV